MGERIKGRVVWFSEPKGFGFIRPHGKDTDIFFHWSYLQMDGFKTIENDRIVSFEIGENHLGEMAVKIELEDEDLI